MPKIYTVEGFAKPLSLHQGTLYEQEGYGTVCAIVKQLWGW